LDAFFIPTLDSGSKIPTSALVFLGVVLVPLLGVTSVLLGVVDLGVVDAVFVGVRVRLFDRGLVVALTSSRLVCILAESIGLHTFDLPDVCLLADSLDKTLPDLTDVPFFFDGVVLLARCGTASLVGVFGVNFDDFSEDVVRSMVAFNDLAFIKSSRVLVCGFLSTFCFLDRFGVVDDFRFLGCNLMNTFI